MQKVMHTTLRVLAILSLVLALIATAGMISRLVTPLNIPTFLGTASMADPRNVENVLILRTLSRAEQQHLEPGLDVLYEAGTPTGTLAVGHITAIRREDGGALSYTVEGESGSVVLPAFSVVAVRTVTLPGLSPLYDFVWSPGGYLACAVMPFLVFQVLALLAPRDRESFENSRT